MYATGTAMGHHERVVQILGFTRTLIGGDGKKLRHLAATAVHNDLPRKRSYSKQVECSIDRAGALMTVFLAAMAFINVRKVVFIVQRRITGLIDTSEYTSKIQQLLTRHIAVTAVHRHKFKDGLS